MARKDRKKRKYSSSSSGSDSSSGSSSSSSSSSGSSRSSRSDTHGKLLNEAALVQMKKDNIDNVAKSMFMETKPDELIDQIFIILDETEIKELCPTIIRHLSIADIKERALKCVLDLNEVGLQEIYENQEMDPGAEEIDKALIQLGLVGNTTKILEREPTKWRSVEEVKETDNSNVEEIPSISGENLDTIFDDIKEPEKPQEPELPKRMLLADAPPESTADAELWRALLMNDRKKLSVRLESSDIISSKLSDKPKDYVPVETPIRRDNHDHDVKSDASSPRSVDIPDPDVLIGNPPLVPIGNPPLADSPSKPKRSYRERAAAAAAEEEEDGMIKADDISLDSESDKSDSESSSSEEGEISDGGGDGGEKVGEETSEHPAEAIEPEIKIEVTSDNDEASMHETAIKTEGLSEDQEAETRVPRHRTTSDGEIFSDDEPINQEIDDQDKQCSEDEQKPAVECSVGPVIKTETIEPDIENVDGTLL